MRLAYMNQKILGTLFADDYSSKKAACFKLFRLRDKVMFENLDFVWFVF